MRLHRSICQLMTIAALLCLPILSYAQTPPTTNPTGASPSGKSTVKVEMVPSLIVMNARGASLQGQTLTLTGVSPNSIHFRRPADQSCRSSADPAPAGGMDRRQFCQGRAERHCIGPEQRRCFGPRRSCRAQGPASRRRPADL